MAKDPRRMERRDIARLANLLTETIFGIADHVELHKEARGIGGWSKPAMAGSIDRTTKAFVNGLARKRRLKENRDER